MKHLTRLALLILICSAPAFAAEDYHPGDVAVINMLLKINDAGNQLLTRSGWEIGRPETWPVLDPSPDADLTTPADNRAARRLAADPSSEAASTPADDRAAKPPANDPPSGVTSTVVDGAGVVWRGGRVVELSLNYGDLVGVVDLSGLSELEVLKICYNREITRLKGLDQLVKLTGLHLETAGLEDIGDLGSLTELRWLILNHNRLTELRGLDRLRRLRRLSLDNNRLTALPGLALLTELRQLNLSRNRLTALEDLSGLKNLHELSAADNLLTSLPGLDELTGLRYLFLARNQLTGLAALNRLTRLKFLDVSGNRLAALKGLGRLEELTLVYIDGNPLPGNDFIKTIDSGRLTDFGFSGDQFPNFSLAAGFPRLDDLVISGETEPRSVDLAGRELESLTLYAHLSPSIFHNSGGVRFGTIIGDRRYRLDELRALRERLNIRNFIVPSPQSPALGDLPARLESGRTYRLETLSPLLAADFEAGRGQSRIYVFNQPEREFPKIINPQQLPPGAVKTSANGEISFPAPGDYYLSLTASQVKMPGFAAAPEVIHYQDVFTVRAP